jgi:cell wall-associated NlpC family hydrolase
MAQARSAATKSPAGYRNGFRRARIWIMLAGGAAIIAFIGLPLRFNGYLFGSPMHDEVFAAAPRVQSPSPAPVPSPAPTPSPAETPVLIVIPTPTPGLMTETAYTTLKQEDDSEAVAALQERLMALGYFDYDEITTYYGTVTKSAVQLFQRASGLLEDGVSDARTQALLFSEQALPYRMKLGDKGSDVRSMQRRLAELGYYTDKDNGYFGIATERAVKAFQKRNNIEETGVIDHTARDLMYSPHARYLVDPTPTPTIKPTPKPTIKPTVKPTVTYDIPVVDDDDVIDTEKTPKPTATPKRTATPEPEDEEPAGSYSNNVSGLIAAAKAQLGKPYVWSEEGPDSFDCSGLVYYALRLCGENVSRYNAIGFSQVSSWKAIDSLDDCKKGDLLFYKSDTNPAVNHTGIYLGNGQFIHASSSLGKVVISETTGYYERNFVIARRVF